MSFEAPKLGDNYFPPEYLNIANSGTGDADLIPEGYVDLALRIYQVIEHSSSNNVETFEEYSASFPTDFQPDQVLSDVDQEYAINLAKSLSEGGYRLLKGYMGILDMEISTVAEVLSRDIDTNIERIKSYLADGAVVAPYVQLETPGELPYYAIGVGLWMKD